MKSVFEEVDTKASLNLLNSVTVGIGSIINDTLVKILDNVRF